MRARIAPLLLLAAIPAAVLAGTPGVQNEARARQNWMLECQGCHRPNATATDGATPALAGFAARFLSVPGGREYLSRVPGVANATISDRDLAELLNWTLYRFDQAHVPAGFRPYTAKEVGQWRQKPLRTEASSVRRNLVSAMPEEPRAR